MPLAEHLSKPTKEDTKSAFKDNNEPVIKSIVLFTKAITIALCAWPYSQNCVEYTQKSVEMLEHSGMSSRFLMVSLWNKCSFLGLLVYKNPVRGQESRKVCHLENMH